MAELVDALASGASGRKVVEVRVFSWAPLSSQPQLQHHLWSLGRIPAWFKYRHMARRMLASPRHQSGQIAAEGVAATVIDSYKPEGALFGMLKELPFYSVVAPISLALIVIFFVTSSDSGSLVIDTITAGGKMDAPVTQRVFWCTREGLVAIALLFGGGAERFARRGCIHRHSLHPCDLGYVLLPVDRAET